MPVFITLTVNGSPLTVNMARALWYGAGQFSRLADPVPRPQQHHFLRRNAAGDRGDDRRRHVAAAGG
jgi:hypothetical protein